jgi:N-acetylglucosamine-6-sulfatase
MPRTRKLMEDEGGMALNFHIHTPICNPSRSELLSGRYFHNIKAVGGPVWSMHVNEERVNAATFAASLKQAGYTCGMVRIAQPGSPCALRRSRLLRWHRGTVRQIHEHYAQQCAARLGRLARQPRGRLHLPQLPNTGPDRARVRCRPEHGSGGTLRRREAIWWMGSPAASNYSTSVIGNVSTAWIKKVVQEDAGRPFMAYIAPKAAHEPFNPAPWYIYIFYGFSSPERDDGTGRSQASELAEHTPRFSDCGRRNDDVSEQVRRLLAGRLATDGAPTGKLELLR